MTSFKFVGLENYSRMFADKVFIKSLINTVIIVIGSVPIVVLFSLFVASQTYHQNAIARSFYRFVFFLPVVTGSVAVTVVWKWIYDHYQGFWTLYWNLDMSSTKTFLGWGTNTGLWWPSSSSCWPPLLVNRSSSTSLLWEILIILSSKQRVSMVRQNCKFSGRSMAKLIANNLVHCDHYDH